MYFGVPKMKCEFEVLQHGSSCAYSQFVTRGARDSVNFVPPPHSSCRTLVSSSKAAQAYRELKERNLALVVLPREQNCRFGSHLDLGTGSCCDPRYGSGDSIDADSNSA